MLITSLLITFWRAWPAMQRITSVTACSVRLKRPSCGTKLLEVTNHSNINPQSLEPPPFQEPIRSDLNINNTEPRCHESPLVSARLRSAYGIRAAAACRGDFSQVFLTWYVFAGGKYGKVCLLSSRLPRILWPPFHLLNPRAQPQPKLLMSW